MASTLRLLHKQYIILLVLFVIKIISSSCVAQTNGSVPVGSSLTATDEAAAWVSPSAEFAFGFQKLEDMDFFLVSIWYNKIPERTIVWYTNGNNPSPRGSTLVLTADSGLVLTNPQGQQTSLSEPIIGRVNNGFINDNGNFLLQNTNSESLWETYQNPADTILPSQIIESDKQQISSRRTKTNFAPGRFQLHIGLNGNFILSTVNLPGTFRETYYFNGPNDSSPSASRYQLVFNESSYIYISRAGNNQGFLISRGDDVGNDLFYNRATLDYDGVFAHYRRPKNTSNSNESWSTVSSLLKDICRRSNDGFGVCGYNMICRLGSDLRPDCLCPQRSFTLVDPNDKFKGCVPNFVQSCGESFGDLAESTYGFINLTNVDWPNGDYEQLEPFTEDSCRRSCLRDCMCYVAIFRGSTCWKKRLPLFTGFFDATATATSAFIKILRNISIPQNPNCSSPNRKNQDTIIHLVSVLLGSSVFINFVLVGMVSFGCFIFYRNKEKRTTKNESFCETNLHNFTYKELVDATNGFKEELGRGSFGIVYKGEIKVSSNTTLIAVKKLDQIAEQSIKEFKTEVNVIGQTHHKNLVGLIGFCDDGLQRLLVYEFLTNGSLASFLFDEKKLHWTQRVQIAIGVAKGLLYLHEECNNPIIHCDIKPQNILLDNSYNARISDFGLAKLLRMDQSKTQTNIRGTKGYVAPEWFRNVPVSVKTDVYSFGVLLLEIICCRRNVDMDAAEDRAILIYWAYDCFAERKMDILVENDVDAINDLNKLTRFVMVAIWCIQEDPYLRPDMKNVVLMLEGIVEINDPPCPSLFSTTIERK